MLHGVPLVLGDRFDAALRGNLLRVEMNFAQHELCFIKKNSLQDSIKNKVLLSGNPNARWRQCAAAAALLKIFLVARTKTQTNTHTLTQPSTYIVESLAYVFSVEASL